MDQFTQDRERLHFFNIISSHKRDYSTNDGHPERELFEPEVVKLVSIMDHSPGQSQFPTLEQYRSYYQQKYGDDMRFTLLGTGNGAMLPVYGCGCKACTRANENAQYRRNKTSAMVEHNGKTLLIDANLPDLMQRFPSGSIDRILLTHYHIDHVQRSHSDA